MYTWTIAVSIFKLKAAMKFIQNRLVIIFEKECVFSVAIYHIDVFVKGGYPWREKKQLLSIFAESHIYAYFSPKKEGNYLCSS